MTRYSATAGSPKATFKFAQCTLPIHQFKKSKNVPFWLKGLAAALAGTDIIVASQKLQWLNVPSVIPQLSKE